ncbi:MAG: MFS transporter [Acidobacteria bacterium]|nr:MFS transporter [Acidobacteriota bacterium]
MMDTPVNSAANPQPAEAAATATEIHDTTDFTQLPLALFRSLAAVVIGTLILRLASQMTGQMLQYYLTTINDNYFPISYTARGFIIAAFFIPELFGSPLLGSMSDRYGRKLFIMLGPILGAIAVQITALTTAIWLLVFTRLLEGLSTASSVPATLGYISEVTTGRPKLRARIIGLFEITLVGGIAIGASLSGYLWKFFATPKTFLGIDLISPAFALNGLIYLACLAVFWWGIREAKKPETVSHAASGHGNWQHFASVVRSPQVWRFVPAWLGINSIIGAWLNTANGLMTGKDHFANQLLTGNVSPERFGNGFAILAIIFSIGVLAWSFAIGSYRRTSVMLLATIGLFATILSVYGLNHLDSFASALHYPLLSALIISVVVLSAFTPAALTYLADVTESKTEDRGSIMGLYSVFLGVGQMIGTTAGGKFATWFGVDGLVLLSGIFGVITMFTLLALRQHEPKFIATPRPS